MLAIVKLVQSIVKALHSEGTPGQVAAGLALGAVVGLLPAGFLTVVVIAAIMLLNVSFPGALLGMALFTPIGFLLDGVFDALGRRLLLESPSLVPLWTSAYNAQIVPLTGFNNTVMMGAIATCVVAFVPLYLGGRWGIARYRATIGERIRNSAWYKSVTASKLYNVYRLFRPET